MNDDFVKDLFLEGVDDQIRQARNIIKQKHKDYSNEKIGEILQRLLNLTEPYQDKSIPRNKPATNQAHLPKLTKFHIRGNINLETLHLYYTRYMNTPSISNKSIERFTDFPAFEREVDANFVADKNAEIKEIDEPPIYSDSNIDVFLGDSIEKCIKYGQGETYGLCISRTSRSTNLYHNYRLDNLTTYFVYFKKSLKNAPAKFILIDVTEDPDSFSYNIITPNIDEHISKSELIETFPELKDAINSNVFKYLPIEGEEKEYYDKWHGKNILSFITLDDQLRFVEMGGHVDWHDFSSDSLLNKHLIAKAYLERNGLLPEWILDEYPDIKKRYIQKIDRMLQEKSGRIEWNYLFDFEREYVKKNKKPEVLYISYLKSQLVDDLTAEEQIDRVRIAKVSLSEYEIENYIKDRKGVFTAMAEKGFYIPDEIFKEFPEIESTYNNSLDEGIEVYIKKFISNGKNFGLGPSEYFDEKSHYLRRCVEKKNVIYDILKREAETSSKIIKNNSIDSKHAGRVTVYENELIPDLSGLSVNSLVIKSKIISELENLPSINDALIIECPLLKSLEGLPKYTKTLYISYNDKLTTLKGLENIIVEEHLKLYRIKNIKTIDYLPQPTSSRNYRLTLGDLKNLKSLKGLPKILDSLTLVDLPKIKNLKGCPFRIQFNFSFKSIGTSLESLEGMPGYIRDYTDDLAIRDGLSAPSRFNHDIDDAMKKRREEEELKTESFKFFYYNLLSEKHFIKNLETINIREISSDMSNVEDRNFSTYLRSDSNDIEHDRSMKGFLGYGVFDEYNVAQGYIYGYDLTSDEYEDYNEINLNSVVFHDEQFKNFIESKGNLQLGDFVKKHFSNNSLYVSNFAVNKLYRISVYNLLFEFVNECRKRNKNMLFFDALSDTIKILKPERLTRHGMRILAEVETYYSKLMVIKI